MEEETEQESGDKQDEIIEHQSNKNPPSIEAEDRSSSNG